MGKIKTGWILTVGLALSSGVTLAQMNGDIPSDSFMQPRGGGAPQSVQPIAPPKMPFSQNATQPMMNPYQPQVTTPSAPAPIDPLPVQPDFYFEQETVSEYKVGMGESVSKAVKQKIALKGGQMLRIDDTESDRITIVRLDKRMIYQIDTAKKAYTETNFQALKLKSGQEEIRSMQQEPQRQAAMDAARQGMMQSMQGMSPQQRAFMQQMMAAQQSKLRTTEETAAAPTAATLPISTTQTLDYMDMLGFKCQRVKFVQGGKKLLEVWITDRTGPQNFLSHFVEDFDIFNADLTAELRKISGFPMQMRYRIQKGPLRDTLQTVTVTKIEPRPLLEASFEVPPGYRLEKEAAVTGSAEEQF